MSDESEARVLDVIRRGFASGGNLTPESIVVRRYPEETSFVVYVAREDFEDAVRLASRIEDDVQSESSTSFVVVRKAIGPTTERKAGAMEGVNDPRASELIRLVGARSRVSNVQPSLVYIPDARASIAEVTAERHHLIFGRRGAGKSALLVEAKRVVAAEGAATSWSNLQALRKESAQRIFLYVIRDLLEELLAQPGRSEIARSSVELETVLADVSRLLYPPDTTEADAASLIPKIQRSLSRSFEIHEQSSFVFLDDFYFIPRDTQPVVLEYLHACSRDASVWLKVGSIKHLTNWWQASTSTGLATGQDTGIIELDATLQKPGEARAFLVGLLAEYAHRVGINAVGSLYLKGAIDRLVLASGAVPRDFLVLATDSIVRARRRSPSAKNVGIQDVNQAAGDAASVKIQELEEDMASNSGEAETTLHTLNTIKEFCLHDRGYTYFLVSYADREEHPEWYGRLTDLMDVRLLHIVEPGVSDPHLAGERLEAFMLDLSQYTGSRLKQNLIVLDFDNGKFLSRATKGKSEARVGSTSLELIAILRAAPRFELERLAPAATVA